MISALWVSVGVLALLGVAEGLAVLALAREVALMARRLPETEAVDLGGGPEVGTTIEQFDALDSRGRSWSLDDQTDKPVVLLFISRDCDPCRAVMRELHLIQLDWPDHAVVPVATGAAAGLGLFRREAPSWKGPILVDAYKHMSRLGIPVTPFALVLDTHKQVVARGVVNDRDSATALLEGRVRATTPADWYLDRD